MPAPLIPHQLLGSTPALTGIGGAKLIVQPVLNVESWPFDKAMPRKLLTAPHGKDHIPDVPNYSWVEYGMRVGVQRIVAEGAIPVCVGDEVSRRAAAESLGRRVAADLVALGAATMLHSMRLAGWNAGRSA